MTYADIFSSNMLTWLGEEVLGKPGCVGMTVPRRVLKVYGPYRDEYDGITIKLETAAFWEVVIPGVMSS